MTGGIQESTDGRLSGDEECQTDRAQQTHITTISFLCGHGCLNTGGIRVTSGGDEPIHEAKMLQDQSIGLSGMSPAGAPWQPSHFLCREREQSIVDLRPNDANYPEADNFPEAGSVACDMCGRRYRSEECEVRFAFLCATRPVHFIWLDESNPPSAWPRTLNSNGC